MSSVMTATSISVDPATNGLDNLVMPDALGYTVPSLSDKKGKRQSSKDTPLLNGNYSGSRTLETLIEQRSLEVDDISSGISGYSRGLSTDSSMRAPNTTNLLGGGTTDNDRSDGSSSEESQDERSNFIFPSATESPLGARKQIKSKEKERRGGNLPPPPLDDFDKFFGSPTHRIQNGSTSSSSPSRYPPVQSVFLNEDLFGIESVTETERHRKQLARERAKAEQKAKLQEERRKEEEAKKQAKKQELHNSIFKHRETPTGIVFQNIAHFDAQAELVEEEKRKGRGSQQSQEFIPSMSVASKYPPSLFTSPQHRWSRQRQPSTDSVDMKVVDDQLTKL